MYMVRLRSRVTEHGPWWKLRGEVLVRCFGVGVDVEKGVCGRRIRIRSGLGESRCLVNCHPCALSLRW